jgi:Protein of unknown function (DUF2911)
MNPTIRRHVMLIVGASVATVSWPTCAAQLAIARFTRPLPSLGFAQDDPGSGNAGSPTASGTSSPANQETGGGNAGTGTKSKSMHTAKKAASKPIRQTSSPAVAECSFDNGKSIRVQYSSPRAKGRKIFGGLVPYGEVWRSGANDATTFVTDTDLSIAGKEIPAGSYTLFTVPNPEKWTLIISKKTDEWGTPYPGEGDDELRADMRVSKLDAPVENLTIAFAKSDGGCVMQLKWEKTEASVRLKEKQ